MTKSLCFLDYRNDNFSVEDGGDFIQVILLSFVETPVFSLKKRFVLWFCLLGGRKGIFSLLVFHLESCLNFVSCNEELLFH